MRQKLSVRAAWCCCCCAVLALGLVQTPTTAAIQAVTDPEAYRVYDALLTRPGAAPGLTLQHETQAPSAGCSAGFLSQLPAEWKDAVRDFTEKNARVWLLRGELFHRADYRFISHEEIVPDDERLWKRYGHSNGRLPEQIEYTAVSAVGFNATKTKAIVYVSSRFPVREALMAMELTNGIWTVRPGGCVGIA